MLLGVACVLVDLVWIVRFVGCLVSSIQFLAQIQAISLKIGYYGLLHYKNFRAQRLRKLRKLGQISEDLKKTLYAVFFEFSVNVIKMNQKCNDFSYFYLFFNSL